MLKLTELVVQPVVTEFNEDDEAVNKHIGNPVSLFNEEQLVEFIRTLKAQLAEQVE